MIRALLGAAALSLAAQAGAAMCADREAPCPMPDGAYHLRLPSAGAPHPPVVMFLHGAGGSGAGALGNASVVQPLLDRGYAVIAPSGSREFRGKPSANWNFLPGWEGRDEPDFLNRVVADAARRHGTDPDRVLLAGFSAGAFMVSYLACAHPDSFAAYAPVSGGFWRPMPKGCAGPVRLFQTHGWRDKVVPLEGRALRGGAFLQGDIFAGMEIWRAANRCSGQDPTSYAERGQFWLRKWDNCEPGSALEFALFPGGHGVPEGWSNMVLDWFEALPPR